MLTRGRNGELNIEYVFQKTWSIYSVLPFLHIQQIETLSFL